MWLALLNQQSELEERLIVWARVFPMGRYLKSLIGDSLLDLSRVDSGDGDGRFVTDATKPI